MQIQGRSPSLAPGNGKPPPGHFLLSGSSLSFQSDMSPVVSSGLGADSERELRRTTLLLSVETENLSSGRTTVLSYVMFSHHAGPQPSSRVSLTKIRRSWSGIIGGRVPHAYLLHIVLLFEVVNLNSYDAVGSASSIFCTSIQ